MGKTAYGELGIKPPAKQPNRIPFTPACLPSNVLINSFGVST